MSETLQLETPEQPQPSRGRSWVAWMGAATIVIALVILMWPSERRSGPEPVAHLPFGAAEQAYADKIQLDNFSLSAAENFLNQEVTTLGGRVTNSGDRAVANVELTVEFNDQLGQVVLREVRQLFPPNGAPLKPTEKRDFEIPFEHIPPSANVQQPAIRITGILFGSAKE